MAVVETERHGQILVVRMNRPERLNALNTEMRAMLADVWTDFLEVSVTNEFGMTVNKVDVDTGFMSDTFSQTIPLLSGECGAQTTRISTKSACSIPI